MVESPVHLLRLHARHAPFNARGLAAHATALVDAAGVRPTNASARSVLSPRAVRFYVANGLIDRPEGTGTSAIYHYRHLLQLLAIKIRQREGQSLETIKREMRDSAGDALERRVATSLAPALLVGGQAVANWYDFHRATLAWLKEHPPAAGADPAPVPVAFQTSAGQRVTAQLPLTAAEATALQNYRFTVSVPFEQPRDARRQTDSPVTAAWWGVTETRDFILQFYLTLRRMVTGDVSAKNMMGPVGIFQAGTGFAAKGTDWLIWFLAMISANLAVVNFLPIPIVDGGLFAFLILEKIKGKPLSAKTQAIAQYIGMALLLGIFLFVTWQDIIWFRFRG